MVFQLTAITERDYLFSVLDSKHPLTSASSTTRVRACVFERVCASHQCLFGFLFICLGTAAAAATPLLLSNKVSSLLFFQRKKETAAVATERVETGAQNRTQHKTRTDRFVASEPIKRKFPKSDGL